MMQAADYIQLLQPPLEHPAAAPAADDASAAAEHRARFDEYSTKRHMSRDRTASAACACLLASALLYNISVSWKLLHVEASEVMAGQPVSALRANATTSVCWVLAHVLMELAFTCYVSREPALYRRHRGPCIMVTRTGLLLLMSLYIPKTYKHTLAFEVESGRTEAATLRLVTGFVAIHVLEVLCFRLPVRLAVPHHSARVLLSFVALPGTLRAFAHHPSVTAFACSLWDQIGQVYLAVASWVLGMPLALDPQQQLQSELHVSSTVGRSEVSLAGLQSLQAAAATATSGAAAVAAGGGGLCTVLVLLVFLSLTAGLLLPLYVLWVWEVLDLRAFMAAGDRSASGSSSTTSSRSPASFMAGSSSNNSSVTSSSGTAARTAGTGSAPSSGAAGAGSSRSGQAAIAGSSGSSGGGGSSLRGSSLLQAALAARASTAAGWARGGPRTIPEAGPEPAAGGDTPAEAAAASGAGVELQGQAAAAAAGNATAAGSSGGGLLVQQCPTHAWPLHFNLALHAIVAFCASGLVWCVVNAAWGQWQRMAGPGSCFLPLLL